MKTHPFYAGPRARTLLASSISLGLMACGGGGQPESATVSPLSAPNASSQTEALGARIAATRPPRVDPPAPAPVIDAKSLTDTAGPLLLDMGNRTYSTPVTLDGLQSPSNYRIAPRLPTWQFATSDPTNGVLTFERETAPDIGWHNYSRAGKVLVTGGSSAAANRVYTVFNKEQLLAAIREAKNEPKIIRIVGHIDFRWRDNNSVFEEYTS
ncbi:MAG TPA: hypothetical protein VGE47_12680, partial [Burkholderiaceae bacterium]